MRNITIGYFVFVFQFARISFTRITSDIITITITITIIIISISISVCVMYGTTNKQVETGLHWLARSSELAAPAASDLNYSEPKLRCPI